MLKNHLETLRKIFLALGLLHLNQLLKLAIVKTQPLLAFHFALSQSVLHTDTDFLALELTNPNVNTDEDVSEVQDSSLLADDPPVNIGSSSNLPVIDASPLKTSFHRDVLHLFFL